MNLYQESTYLGFIGVYHPATRREDMTDRFRASKKTLNTAKHKNRTNHVKRNLDSYVFLPKLQSNAQITKKNLQLAFNTVSRWRELFLYSPVTVVYDIR